MRCRDDEAKTEDFVALLPDGLATYVSNLYVACRKRLAETGAQPRLLQLAEHVRQKNIILQSQPLDVVPRHPTTLNNQLFKLRWRCVRRKRHD